jgi:hypothetical protein
LLANNEFVGGISMIGDMVYLESLYVVVDGERTVVEEME